ncbi:primosomal protein N' [Oxalobacter paraformigenes]|uniref:Replication restart protein PriA n=1 Tax=Oxalobacter paraformigenes TaxID=556268 RepID=C3X5A7_9BURK|nr:primosomal protein N' [Oxalobacter paraformigenes]EEO28393.1 primosomal protein N' [Oxalobacter paraformigenes]
MSYLIVQVVFDTPLDFYFDYRYPPALADERKPHVGQLIVVPFGRREETGLIVGIKDHSDVDESKLKDVISLCQEVPPLPKDWIDLCRFAARYYQRSLGEVALPAVPKKIRQHKKLAIKRALKALEKKDGEIPGAKVDKPELHQAQQKAVSAIMNSGGFAPFVLYGVTGSGKTEIYLQATEQTLEKTPDVQVLIMVPEINLTPQLEKSVRDRFPQASIATLHSRLTESDRLKNWLGILTGNARIILGTRLAILAPAPKLGLIIVDEEHDPSYKQQEGLRYSARDLAVWRASQLKIPVVLGSATPSLESWQRVLTGHYTKLELPERAVKDALLPSISLIDTTRQAMNNGLSPELVAAIRRRLEKGEQSLLFLNRRGYAPVMTCEACGWVSACTRCSAYMVYHKAHRLLRCHHCGLERPIPRVCPDCGNADLQMLGRGTQRIEEGLKICFPEAGVLRIDADSTSKKGSLLAALQSVHRGEIDIVVGTQMIAKGHDFRNLTLVGVLNPDTALFSHDYRAGERLFAQLMQVAGRAGRSSQKTGANASEVLIQTRYPAHPLYQAALSHNYEKYVNVLLAERKSARLPPFGYQALLSAEARKIETALAFLQEASALVPYRDGIVINEAVPMAMMRIANMERAQLLIESASRPDLQHMLREWVPQLRNKRTNVRWHIEVDPIAI